ncbi:MAG TPA: hypothetical protein VEU30_15855 [Thermoanaerobaculia bacterium]|nr:hypothetical protein [Thermoanaerobaculia bacterium]
MNERSADVRAFYETYGISREAWFFQHANTGDVVIAVTDAAEPVREHASDYGAAQDAFATWFKDSVKKLTGIDPNVMPLGPPTEQVFDSSGGGPLEPRAPLVVRAYPLKSREALEDFVEDLHRRPDETRAMYASLGAREIWFEQNTGHGWFAVVVGVIADPDRVAKQYASATDRFSIWFKQRVEDVSGVNPHRSPLGPGTEKVFDYP